MTRVVLGLVIAVAWAPWGLAETMNPTLDLEGIQALQLADVRIDSVKHDDGGGFFEIDGFIGGTIGFEVLLPDEWNGRFAMGGGGGFVGSVQYATRGEVRKGYAVAGTDTGHQEAGLTASWALDDQLAQVNFGHVAIHRTAEVAKALIRAAYGQGPEYSYFLGCSRGGGQAMMESQRYPEDFDGIVAGAPAFDWSGIAATFVHTAQVMYPDPKSLDTPMIPQDLLGKIYDTLMAQCDVEDGVQDGIIRDPRDIEFDLTKVPGITPEQVKVMQAVYGGSKNEDGPIYPGFSPGSEADPSGFFSWISGPVPGMLKSSNIPTATFGFGTEVYKNFVFNDPDWDYSTYDFATWAEDTHLAGTTLNATNPDLSDFKARGGKLVIWHGWADPALPPLATIDYFEKVKALDPSAEDYVRLFMISGCLHCGGGPGPSQVDWLEVIVNWVENDAAPNMLIVSKSRGSGNEPMTRPVFPYPVKAQFNGEGDTDVATSFIPQ